MTTTAEVDEEQGEETPGEPEAEAHEADEDETAHEAGGDGESQPELPIELPEGFNPERFEREQSRHERELKKALGDAFEAMEACERCGGVGFAPRDYVEAPPALPDPTLVVCDDCNGYGVRETPSRHPQYLAVPCTVCQGRGYRDRSEVEADRVARSYAEQAAAAAAQPPQPVWNQATGQWELPGGQPLVAAVPSYPPPPALA